MIMCTVQGGLDEEKRKDCADQLTQRQVPGKEI
jgi:queuine/archaeosine tRNA-ribosyltransferase